MAAFYGEDFALPMDVDDETTQTAIAEEIATYRQNVPYNEAIPSFSDSPLNQNEKDYIQQQSITMGENHQYSAVFVVDTSFLISHLRFLKSVLDAIPVPEMVLYIPYVVLKELDSLKDSTKLAMKREATAVRDRGFDPGNVVSNELIGEETTPVDETTLGTIARQAIDLIYRTLSARHLGIRGQRLTEYLPNVDLRSLNNDDKILECCRYAQVYYTQRVVLLSNDKNLCVKALVHSIYTVSNYKNSAESFIAEARSQLNIPFQPSSITSQMPTYLAPPPPYNDGNAQTTIPDYRSKVLHQSAPISVMDIDSFPEIHSMEIDMALNPSTIAQDTSNEHQNRQKTSSNDPIDVLIRSFSDCLVGAMTVALPVIFEATLAQDWPTKIARKPPWNLEDIFEMLEKHWFESFRSRLPRSLHQQLPRLKFLGRGISQGKVTVGDMKNVIKAVKCLKIISSDAGFHQDAERLGKQLESFETFLDKL